MLLPHLPDDLILYIWHFMKTNKEMNTLVRTCKEFKSLGNRFGFIKSIRFGMHTDYMNFIKLHHNGKNEFFNKLTMERLNNPLPWIPGKWPNEIIFERCYMGKKLIDPPVSETQILVIRDINRKRRNSDILCINWKKLPELRILDIYATDMDFTGLENCTKLEWIRVDLCNNNRFLPKFFEKFTKLRIVATNCPCAETLNFVSDQLKICFVQNKLHDFKAVSKILPPWHLLRLASGMINIQLITY